MGRVGNYILYFVPWILAMLAVLGLNVAATVYYIIDFIHTSVRLDPNFTFLIINI